jgi:hypothetical protein
MNESKLLIQLSDNGKPRAGLLVNNGVALLEPAQSVYELASRAIAERTTFAELIQAFRTSAPEPFEQLTRRMPLLPPVTHPEPARLHASGTGLTHLGSASTRNQMHKGAAEETDSLRMFCMGLEGGRPEGDEPGVQPEWFYKGNGHALVAPGSDLVAPSFALDGGEEPELAGIYLIGPDGTPNRLGFALSNEFSDHVTERGNYLWLAHSKLRPFSIGPALRTGPLPQDIQGTSRILRDGREIWSAPFLTGEANMSHSLANLEHHHFKYDLFRRAGDLHVHMFGTATLSFADGVTCTDGDVYEISAPGFGPALRNRLRTAKFSQAQGQIERRQAVASL